ncbi:secreted protein [Frondihabitans sp. PhB188]|uniref:twin-arginine translocation signal domain-containing protein n=1 Tax=Frondihabitans sp. PhB188 TaxID=2485200 RepID=UPI000FB4F76A|nr:twin-arginine translocation signal domain-containing protein [Frondihabitans sp. PhB188]ROQ37048.1 secreted protein [Frondihabitans sp. PhB188]
MSYADGLSRRGFLMGSATLAGAALTTSLLHASPAHAAAAAAPSATSIANGYAFLQSRFNQYGSGSTLRVPQSYTGGIEGANGFVSSFAYDDAIVILAWLASGTAANIQLATVLGDSLLYAQDHDPLGDGRTRASYQPNPFITSSGAPYIGSAAANTGNQAWVGIALARLSKVTGQTRFLQGALTLGNWIQTHTWDAAKSPNGYTGGRDASNTALTYKATEHNIDIGAFFTMLATLTGAAVWTTRATAAFAFVAAMKDTATGHLWTGTNTDGTSINRTPIPGDIQNWAYLATASSNYSPAVTWVNNTLTTTDAGLTGSSYSDADTTKVWLEGTAHLALAVRARGATGDPALYSKLMTTIQTAQATAPTGDGLGIVAASSNGLITGFGDTYNATLHLGATAWYLLAAQGANPLRL